MVTDNVVEKCAAWGIGLQAPPLAAAVADIACNRLVTAGPGIIGSVNGFCVRDNDIVFAGATKGAQDGITVFALYGGDLLPDCQITGNRITGYGAAAIGIRSPTGRAIVTRNQIAHCGGGIALEYAAVSSRPTEMIAIDDNQLSDIAASVLPGATANAVIAAAVWVHNANVVHIAGNAVVRLATAMPVAQSRVAILVWGSEGAHVARNSVSDVGPVGGFTGPSSGISVLEPFGAVEIGENQVRRYSATTVQPAADSSEWLPLLVLGTLPDAIAKPAYLASSGFGTFGSSVAAQTDVAGANVARLLRVPLAVAAVRPPLLTTERVAVRRNQFEGFGSAPVCLVSSPADCVFINNHCLLATPESQLKSSGDVILAATSVIATGNRIAGGGGALAITVSRPTAATVLGNITRGAITLDGSALAAPWNALNVSSV